jgi:Putative peptidoglycan binding domain/Mannosyl-glycoprotein endo-beta-N-acetylglucosaminidase/CHAP domain
MPQGTIFTEDLFQSDTATLLQLESYLKQKAPNDSPFKVEKRIDLLTGIEHSKIALGLNPIFILAFAIHESGWGRSQIAKVKNNLFGWGAFDADPFNKAWSFDSYQECIDVVMKTIKQIYLTTGGTYFNGTTLKGMNVKYATDNNWASGIRALMNEIDSFVSSDNARPIDPPARIDIGIFQRYLSRDMQGDDVRKVQTQLAALGLYDPRLIGGTFGPITEETVKKFQLQNNLEVDGIVGPLTWKALGGTVSDVASRLIELAKIAKQEADLGLSWNGATSKAEKYLKPLRKPMQDLGQIGTNPVFYDWCGAFVLYCCRQVGFALPNTPPSPNGWATFALVQIWHDWAKQKGFWFPRRGFVPSAGDIVIFDWSGTSGLFNHIGIVRSYTPGSTSIETSEGNAGNVTANQTRSLTTVLGFIRLPETL